MRGEVDNYNIPGDTGWPWRMDKFVEYQHAVPAIHPIFLDGYMVNHESDFTQDDYVWVAWLISCTYNEITTVFLFEQLKAKFPIISDVTKDWCDDFWKKNRENILFNSARKYVKANNQFTQLMIDFIRMTKGKPYQWVQSLIKSDDPIENYTTILHEVKSVPNVVVLP